MNMKFEFERVPYHCTDTLMFDAAKQRLSIVCNVFRGEPLQHVLQYTQVYRPV